MASKRWTTSTITTKSKSPSHHQFWIGIFIILTTIDTISGQCPWQRDILDLQTSCLCAYNLGHELSVQCDQVNFSVLIDALNRFAKNTPIDLLYINNSTIENLTDDIFINLRLHNVQLSSCSLKQIEDASFKGQETYLKNLNLQDNLLEEVPIRALRTLTILNLLDLSKNRITWIPDNAFQGLGKLSTLKLNDNNVTLSPNAFHGLENCLKNLNLKGTKQKRVPECVRGLKLLAFLDLSQNGIHELPGPGGVRTFEGLDTLTALNLERNLIQNLGENAFAGVRKTLSSLSLLNNLLAEFPVGAIHALRELRVLDIGFNLLTTLPEVAFRGNPSLTLLALDGNPLPTVPEKALLHLNQTLRGLSLGGRFLHCDCKLQWVAEWIRNGDLQVTSRERNPQFCGTPNRFRDRGFYSIQPEELACPESDVNLNGPVGIVDSLVPKRQITSTAASTTAVSTTSSAASSTTTISPKKPNEQSTSSSTEATSTTLRIVSTTTTTTTSTTPVSTTTSTTSTSAKTNPPSSSVVVTSISPTPPLKTASQHQTSSSSSSSKVQSNWRKPQRPPLVLGFPSQRGTRIDDANEVQVKNAFRQDSSVIIQWDSDTANILGFRVVYRLFGEKTFKQGPPLEASEREFKIKNVPSQECIVVCVISLEELNVTPDNVPYSQCREVRTVSSATSNMDKITIAASAAICGTIIVAMIIFIATSRMRSRKLQSSQQKSPLPIGGIPVNCCGPAGSPGPLGSIATLSAFNNHKDWDQVSAYSGRSIPRPRIYPMESQGIADDLRSHASHFSGVGKVGKARYSTAGSTHTLNNYCDTSDNWTDHDMDIYMARNATTRNGLVPL